MKRSELKQRRGRTKKCQLVRKKKREWKAQNKGSLRRDSGSGKSKSRYAVFSQTVPLTSPIHFCHKMIRYKQGHLDQHNLLTSDCSSEAMMELRTSEHVVIFQIIKILLKVKLLWVSIPAHICDPTLGKLLGKSIWRDAVQKQWKSTPTSAVITNKAGIWFFFFSKGKVKTFFFLTEQSVHSYITHRTQEVISFLPVFQGNRLHPRSHSILCIFCSSSSF